MTPSSPVGSCYQPFHGVQSATTRADNDLCRPGGAVDMNVGVLAGKRLDSRPLMADLFLHLCFARRLRLTEGLHPLAAEALARRPSLVALGATLPLLPGVERKGMSFFRRLFSGGSDAAKWQKQLAAPSAPRGSYVGAILSLGDLGGLARLSLGLGALAHDILEAKLGPLTPQSGDRAGVERAQARLWMQAAVPNAADLESEWQAAADLADADLHRRTFDQLDNALKAAFSKGPGRDALHRWARGLSAEVAVANPLPPSLGVADHIARGPHFEQAGVIEKLQEATTWFVVVANRLAEQAGRDESLSESGVARALCDGGSAVVGPDAPTPSASSWGEWINQTRARTLRRGKNDQPAFVEGVGEVKQINRSNAFTGVMRLSDLPPGEVPPELKNPSLPPESSTAPPPPMTQEINIAQIHGLPPLPLDASGPVPVAWPSVPPTLAQSFAAPPSMTQEISPGQIIESTTPAANGFAAPSHTQEVAAVQIESQATDDPPRE